jgi:hypothetical protein
VRKRHAALRASRGVRGRFGPVARENEEPEDQTFTIPMLGALYGSVVVVVVIAILNSHIGRGFEDDVDAPARTLVAAPVIVAATVVVVASLAALVPGYRRPSLKVAEIAAWLIPAWLVMSGMALAAISFALHHAS